MGSTGRLKMTSLRFRVFPNMSAPEAPRDYPRPTFTLPLQLSRPAFIHTLQTGSLLGQKLARDRAGRRPKPIKYERHAKLHPLPVDPGLPFAPGISCHLRLVRAGHGSLSSRPSPHQHFPRHLPVVRPPAFRAPPGSARYRRRLSEVVVFSAPW